MAVNPTLSLSAPVNGLSSAQTAAQSGTTSSSSASASQTGMNSLNENDFMQLLVTQLQNQDPLNPVDNTQMLAQLAQFSALEEMTQVAQTDAQVLSAVQNLESEMSLLMAHSLIGASVTVQDASGNQVQGTVSSVTMNQGTPQIVVNGTSYPLTQVVGMA
ncbi:flagellar hook capping FlgD N-terminal domain-containing protein [Alicyclobacillus acidocaldarius]|uniref:Flagellar hook capping protein n=1 Tax=Alicyclobacillus acidocaldarius subsp. acidocaldarius (strain ATCC 27009 / DSM 446 / BCRC 14685 / JCM 5260 / KCTC 1825 / NBRC 15652 / NCIMB 11725 / NRRL B-14509 / 104-IA) TaxID=521098 RepID=C8WWF2_ALIAD|nr:flagellar hook capping FlgD N-terminal domain-containing protein [Alicyclobacillus acidocaldarius]ACV58423.1 flagellar hook capping protein [Alicyclobacillus acidocaldarius subsp. acidocaldarius DSM 446]